MVSMSMTSSSQVINGHGSLERPAKRTKIHVNDSDGPKSSYPATGRIFAPFRTIGLVSPTSVPFTSIPLGKTTFQITTSTGNSLQTYDLRKGLALQFITRPRTPQHITTSLAWKDRIFAAWGGDSPGTSRGIWVFKRGKRIQEVDIPVKFQENIRQLCIFGDWMVGCCDTTIEIWTIATLEHYTSLTSPYSVQGGVSYTGGICNMPTYVNKIFAGKTDGSVEIWNVKSGKLLYTILPETSELGAVTMMEPTPTLGLIAIGYQSGAIAIHDIHTDTGLMLLSTGSNTAPITTISFRSDGIGAGDDGTLPGVMATASSQSGDVTLWDLNQGGRRKGVLRAAHGSPDAGRGVPGGISKLEFLQGQAVMVTTGLDNSLKTWIFDETPFSPIPRPLHARSGHAGPVACLNFLPTPADGADVEGKWLMSAGKDRSLWGWSLRKDSQSVELSQGSIIKKAKKLGVSGGPSNSNLRFEDLKAPPISCMACSLNRDGGIGAMPGTKNIWNLPGQSKGKSSTADSSSTGWESIVTGHEGDRFARTWFWGRKRAGRWKFETGDKSPVTAVTVSPCGTFALIGSSSGGIDMFNLQSGSHRRRFPPKLTSTQAQRLAAQRSSNIANGRNQYERGEGKHTQAVSGIIVDPLNQKVISCGLDGKLKFWEFSTGILLHQMEWASSILAIRHQPATDLIAVSCNEACIRIVDFETKKTIRELRTAGNTVQDFCFSNDARWLVAACSDSTIRIWDLPTGHLIDALRTPSLCLALAFSPTGEYLATAFADTVGVDVWTNRTLFTQVPTHQISEDEIARIDVPSRSGGVGLLESAYQPQESGEVPSGAQVNLEQLSSDLMTLSLVPKPRWQTLLNLDVIRERNRPKEAPKRPEKAPFFLPSITDTKADAMAIEPVRDSRIAGANLSVKVRGADPIANMHGVLLSAQTQQFEDAYIDVVSCLSQLPPSAADVAIRSLSPSPPYSELTTFVTVLDWRLKQRKDFELCLVWMRVFLRCHGAVIAEEGPDTVRETLREWIDTLEKEDNRVRDLVSFCNGIGNWVRGP
ncbi:Utp21-domain-containing protein [Eremomyces bilateralis CBS 781.70]|uniref:Utp21-domain-containing protein n=1 Tax=Eremomyces bilateralis CBS 781.70 TaxID=1392243 RepID=A0A6G1G5B8_9PEZI|nr:Utp21-domain-containing protein [Eremomyces bilateralis CBS 781.70]KAF1813090.1 Utp21-domain-containing protein [Eremomyces bilateralis CBS 781.70]